MKRLPVVILVVVAVLVAIATGCRNTPRYDVRLAAADSLMRDDADSALAMLEALPLSDLHTAGDSAYRDLLLTQARYKTFQPFDNDSIINCALAYYKLHPKEKEKYTRSYLYKGAVMEELGHPDSAMYFYKTAEAHASPDDYANLGQINTRIANLFRVHYGDVQKCFEKYQTAYKYYVLTGNKKLQLNSLFNMIMMNGITHQEKQDEYLNKAMTLAEELGDHKKKFEMLEMRCRQLSRSDETRLEAKNLALECLSKYEQYVNNDLLLDLAYLYSLENNVDSAKFFMNAVNNSDISKNEHIEVRKHEILSLMAIRDGRSVDGGAHMIQSNRLSDSILNSTDKYRIEKIESNFNHLQEENYLSKISLSNWIITGLAFMVIVGIMIFVTLHQIHVKKTKSIIEELQKSAVDEHSDILSQLDSKNTVIEHMLTNLVAFMKSYSGVEAQHSSTEIARTIKETFGGMIDDEFWDELALYLNKHHNDIITNLADCPRIKKKDIRLIELLCCGFSDVEIAIILDYSTKYIWNKKKVIAAKLGIDSSLQEYLKQRMALKA